MNRWIIFLLGLLTLFPVGICAQTTPAPALMNFQGRLARPDGTPVADGNYSLRFSLWDAASSGTEKWFQVMNPVLVRNGTFAVLLGNGNPLTETVLNGNVWLEIQVGSDAPQTPRQQIVSVAYAIKANTVPDNAITTTKIADSAVTDAKIQNVDWSKILNFPAFGGDLTGTLPNPTIAANAVTNAKIAANAVTTEKILDGTITGADIADGTIGSAEIGSNAVISVKIAADAVTSGKLATEAASLNRVSGGVMTSASNRIGIGTASPTQALDVNGWVRAQVLDVTGGSDVAEPYHVAPAGPISPLPGMVVSIDPKSVGRMRVASRAYDRTVGGIISGAKGIRPGLLLRQAGTVADGALPITSMGRVWVRCDAGANGAIRPGDLLTTSNTPGHAMRVTSARRANGAILGKAMSSLKKGRGMVLVLVSLK
jgi:hypothetical protein